MTIGFGIVGCGMIANFHAQAIGRIRGTRITACLDTFTSAADRFAAANKCTAYRELSGLLADSAVDVVTICTPSGAHRDPEAMMQSMRKALTESLRDMQDYSTDELLKRRFERLMSYGKFKQASAK